MKNLIKEIKAAKKERNVAKLVALGYAEAVVVGRFKVWRFDDAKVKALVASSK